MKFNKHEHFLIKSNSILHCHGDLFELAKYTHTELKTAEWFFKPLSYISFCLQNFLRNQNNKTNYNLVCETLQFLDCICGSTTGGLGLLGLYINEKNVVLVNQTLESLTEYCQGPCHENQVTMKAVLNAELFMTNWGQIVKQANPCAHFKDLSSCFARYFYFPNKTYKDWIVDLQILCHILI